VEKYDRVRHATNDSIIRRTRFACWMTKATDTHSEYVIFLALTRQQELRELVSMSRLYVMYDLYNLGGGRKLGATLLKTRVEPISEFYFIFFFRKN